MLELYFFNVGHGDSIAVKFPNNEWGVIDCNLCDCQKTPNVLKFLRNNGAEKLNFVCVTHPHLDHFNGIDKIVENYENKIDNFIIYNNGQSTIFERKRSPLTVALEKFVKFKNGKFCLACQRDIYFAGDFEIKLVNPSVEIAEEFLGRFFKGNEMSVLNKESVVMLLEYAGRQILLNADVPEKESKNIMQKNNISADIIKISHHGSIHNNPEDLLISIGNKGCISIISSDGNRRYDSVPDPNVLKCLEEKLKSDILKTYDLNANQSPDIDLSTIDAIDSASENVDEPVTDGYFKVTIDECGQISTEVFQQV